MKCSFKVLGWLRRGGKVVFSVAMEEHNLGGLKVFVGEARLVFRANVKNVS